jgi:glycosyltransferase involved in cell wall biosynthesis
VAYVGSVQPHKGAHVFEEVARRLNGSGPSPIRFSVHGGGDPELLHRLKGVPGVEVHGYYRSGTLPDLLRRRAVDLALLLSVVPESYSLSLSECRAAGVPVLAFDHGAIAERLRRDGGGELVPPEKGAAGVAERLRELLQAGVVRPRPTELPTAAPAAAAMVSLYRGLGLA